MTNWIVHVDGVGYEVEAAGVMSALAMVLGAHSRTSDRDIVEIVMLQETALQSRQETRETNATSELSQEENKALSPSSNDVSQPAQEEEKSPSEVAPQTSHSDEPESTPVSNPSPTSKPRRSRSRKSATQSSSLKTTRSK